MMKKTMTIIVTLMLILTLGACNPKTETMTATIEQNDILTEMMFTAKGDKVNTIQQITKLDMTKYDTQTLQILENSISELGKIIEDIKGVTYSVEHEDDILIETINYDLTKADLNELVNNSLLEVERDADYISLKSSKDSLKAEGWTISK